MFIFFMTLVGLAFAGMVRDFYWQSMEPISGVPRRLLIAGESAYSAARARERGAAEARASGYPHWHLAKALCRKHKFVEHLRPRATTSSPHLIPRLPPLVYRRQRSRGGRGFSASSAAPA